ncbi:serine/threonine protein kinase [Candidatus Parcubacteria bacterium]|nr:MAG: serine/threonine protein kinase [Candidatus Parcubacteria bacterium]
MKLKPGVRIGPFLLREKIGEGGMAQVWAAKLEGKKAQVDVAIKISRVASDPMRQKIHDTAIRDEAELLSSLAHPRIVKMLPIPARGKIRNDSVSAARAIHVDGQPWYFVMEYLSGGTVEDYLKKYGKLSIPQAVNIVGNIGLGIRYLHNRGLAHNDIKAENIVFRTPIQVGQQFDPVLIDFGIAAGVKRLAPPGNTSYITPPELLSYVYPEALAEHRANNLNIDKNDVDLTKIDIWALGVLLYRMLTGRLPFRARSLKSLLEKIAQMQPEKCQKYNPEIPSRLDDFIVGQMLSKRPDDRPGINDVLSTLRPYGSERYVGSVVATKG